MEENLGWSTDDAWDWITPHTHSGDALARGGDLDVRDLPMDLVRAARASALSGWYPQTSHNYLRFTDCEPFWPEVRPDVREAPGFIGFFEDPSDGSPCYAVFRGILLLRPDPVCVMRTKDAVSAVAALVELMAEHPAHQWGS